jgi:hypothetical protein
MAEEPHSEKQLLARFRQTVSLSEEELKHHLDRLSARGLLMRENDTYLGLVVLRGASVIERPAPPAPDVVAMRNSSRALETVRPHG